MHDYFKTKIKLNRIYDPKRALSQLKLKDTHEGGMEFTDQDRRRLAKIN